MISSSLHPEKALNSTSCIYCRDAVLVSYVLESYTRSGSSRQQLYSSMYSFISSPEFKLHVDFQGIRQAFSDGHKDSLASTNKQRLNDHLPLEETSFFERVYQHSFCKHLWMPSRHCASDGLDPFQPQNSIILNLFWWLERRNRCCGKT